MTDGAYYGRLLGACEALVAARDAGCSDDELRAILKVITRITHDLTGPHFAEPVGGMPVAAR